jgi:hypothetical protein
MQHTGPYRYGRAKFRTYLFWYQTLLIIIRYTKFSKSNLVFCFYNVFFLTVALIESASRKQSIYLQTLKVVANDRSAQEIQNGL